MTPRGASASGTIRALVVYSKAVGVWFGFVALAALVSGVRTAVLLPALGEHRAHQAATVATAALVLAATVLFVRATRLRMGEAVRVGLLWLTMSIVAEFVLLHYWLGVAWSRLFADYDLRRGRLFALVLLTELVGPPLIVRLASRPGGR